MAYLSLSGNIPELRAALQIWVKGEIINGALTFMIRLDISSYPQEFLAFKALIIFLISWVEAYCHFNVEKGLL